MPCPSNIMFLQVEEMNQAFGNPRCTPLSALLGDPQAHAQALSRLTSQCANIGHEFDELKQAKQKGDMAEIRDALCDIMVFALGAFHFMGLLPMPHAALDGSMFTADDRRASSVQSFLNLALFLGEEQAIAAALNSVQAFVVRAYREIGHDLDADMTAVYESNMSKFCANEQELQDTCAKYADLGVVFYTGGEFPHKFLKSSYEQTDTTGERYPKGKFLKGIRFHKPVFA